MATRQETRAMKWYVTSKNIDEIVEAINQWEAFDSLSTRSADDFGLVVEAQPVNETEEESFAIRTLLLFARWNRPEEAQLFIAAAIKQGLPDTSADLESGGQDQ